MESPAETGPGLLLLCDETGPATRRSASLEKTNRSELSLGPIGALRGAA
jgi:hypothetical protein